MAEESLVRRKCDYCGGVQEFPAQQREFRPDEAAKVAGWIVLVRMFLVHQQIMPVTKHACKDSCASNIIALGMLDLPQEVKDMLAEEERRAADMRKKLSGLSIAELGAEPANAGTLPTPAGEA